MTQAPTFEPPPRSGRYSFGPRPFGRRAGPDLVIEGEAVVLSRRARARADVPLQGAWAEPGGAGAPLGDDAFVLRGPAAGPEAAAGATPAEPIFPGAGGAPAAAALGRSARRTLPVAAAGAAAGLVAMAAVAFAALPEAAPEPRSAPAVAAGITLGPVAARIEARNGGAVLAVEGTIRNASASPRPVPPLSLSLTQADGVLRAQPVVPLGRALGPGETLRFQTMVAVPPGSRAEGVAVAVADGTGSTDPAPEAGR